MSLLRTEPKNVKCKIMKGHEWEGLVFMHCKIKQKLFEGGCFFKGILVYLPFQCHRVSNAFEKKKVFIL